MQELSDMLNNIIKLFNVQIYLYVSGSLVYRLSSANVRQNFNNVSFFLLKGIFSDNFSSLSFRDWSLFIRRGGGGGWGWGNLKKSRVDFCCPPLYFNMIFAAPPPPCHSPLSSGMHETKSIVFTCIKSPCPTDRHSI